MLRNSPSEYGSISKLLHWVIFLLMVAMVTSGFIMTNLTDSPQKFTIYGLHKSTGLLILGLTALRIIWALNNRKPLSRGKTGLEKFLERATHMTLYALLLAMPLSGWVMSTSSGHTPRFYGLFDAPMPGIGLDKALDGLAENVHEILAWVIIVLVSLHMLAALKHHFVDKDDVLKRMMPK